MTVLPFNAEDAAEKVRKTIAFQRSAILSGEPWTETAALVASEGYAALDDLLVAYKEAEERIQIAEDAEARLNERLVRLVNVASYLQAAKEALQEVADLEGPIDDPSAIVAAVLARLSTGTQDGGFIGGAQYQTRSEDAL